MAKAMDLFWGSGYERSSVQDLLDGMGINRGSMYGTFGDKHALFVQTIRHYGQTIVREIIDTLEAPGPPLDNIRRVFLKTVPRWFTGRGDRGYCRGCLITNTAVELAPHDPVVAREVRSSFKRLEKAFRRALERAVATGELDRNVSPRAQARFLTSCIQGLVVMSKAGVGASVLDDITAVSLSVLE